MRGRSERQQRIFVAFDLESRVPDDLPLRIRISRCAGGSPAANTPRPQRGRVPRADRSSRATSRRTKAVPFTGFPCHLASFRRRAAYAM